MKRWHPNRPRSSLWRVLQGLVLLLTVVVFLLGVVQVTGLWRGAYCLYLPLMVPMLGLWALLYRREDRPAAVFCLVMLAVVCVVMLVFRYQLMEFYRVLFRLLTKR